MIAYSARISVWLRRVKWVGPALFFLFVPASLLASDGGSGRQEGVLFEVPIDRHVAAYIPLLRRPALIAVALENAGLSPARVHVLDGGRACMYKGALLQFNYEDRGVYYYSFHVDIGVLFGVKVEFDSRRIGGGRGGVRIHFPADKMFSDRLRDWVSTKVQMVTRLEVQAAMVRYLDQLTGRGNGDALSDSSLYTAILIDGYNRSTGKGRNVREPGDAVPLSDQWMFFATLFIWLILLPSFLIVRALWRRFCVRGR